MKKILLSLFLLLVVQNSFSQDLLLPEKSKSFGLNHHTNRDTPYYTHLDSNGNSIVVSTTERDTTFTDVLITKLDANLDLIWKKRNSINTNLSFDIPIKSFLSINDEIYVLGRSRLNESGGNNGLIFILKYSANGDMIYSKTIGNVDGSDYYNYGYLDAELNDDGTMSLVYAPIENSDTTPNTFKFLLIDNLGEISNSFSKQVEYSRITGKINKGEFYFLVKGQIEGSASNAEFNFYRISANNEMSSVEITDETFVDFYKDAPLRNLAKLIVNSDYECYITFHNPDTHETKDKIHFSKITNNNTLTYSILSSENEKLAYVDSFVNNDNKYIVVANDVENNATILLTIDDTNSLKVLSTYSNILATGVKMNKDGTFFLTSSNSNIRLYSQTLSELKSFNTTDTYELIDFVKVDNNTIVTAGIKYEKMYPESDFFTQLDIQVEKISGNDLLKQYTYSGGGTSKSFQQKVIVDNDGNYLVLVTEKMGPEYLGIGGADPPLNNRIIKFDPDLNVIWESEFPDIVLNVVHHGSTETRYSLDSNNDLYLNLPVPAGTYSATNDLYKVSASGEISFVTNSIPAIRILVENDNIHVGSIQYRNTSTNASQFSYYIVNKNTGETIHEKHTEDERFLTLFKSGEDIYMYTYLGTGSWINNISLYKNEVKIYDRNLPRNNGVSPIIIDKHGSLYFITHFANDYYVNKLDVENNHLTTEIVRDVKALKQFTNGKIYVLLEDSHNALLYDNNLNFLRLGKPINTDGVPFLMSRNNHIIIGYNDDTVVKVVDEQGQIVGDYRTKTRMYSRSAGLDNKDQLIMVGQVGNKIYTFNEYSWSKAFIVTYKILDGSLSVSEINEEELEYKIFPNPTSDILNVKVKNQAVKKIKLFDLSGKFLKVVESSQISLANFTTGIYFLRIETSANVILNAKVIKN